MFNHTASTAVEHRVVLQGCRVSQLLLFAILVLCVCQQAAAETSIPDTQNTAADGSQAPAAEASIAAAELQQAPAAEHAVAPVQEQRGQQAAQQLDQGQQQQQPTGDAVDLDSLLGELLSKEQQQQHKRSIPAPFDTPRGTAAVDPLPAAAASSQLSQLAADADSLLIDLDDDTSSGAVMPTSAAAASAAAAAASDTQLPHLNGVDTAAAAAAAANITAADGFGAGHSSRAAGNAADSGVVANGDDDDDDMLDMLHDMAEVLEVEQPAAQLQPTDGPAAAAAAGSSVAGGCSMSGGLPGHSQLAQQQQLLQGHGVVSGSQLPTADILPTFAPPVSATPAAPAPAAFQQGQLAATSGQTAAAQQEAAAAAGLLPPHELALQQAWEYEEMLFHGGMAAQQAQHAKPQQQQQQRRPFQRLDPQARLFELLSDAKADWNSAGRPAASGGAMIGGAVLLKLESLAGLFAGAAGGSAGGSSSSSGGGGAGGAAAGVDWSQVLAAALAPHGPLQVGVKQHQ
jgi:hypothetical protein